MKNISIDFHSQITSFILKKKTLIKQWIINTLSNENKTASQISFIFCDDQYLLNLNKEYLKHDTFTDIITFDYSEKGIISGDIFISIERVKENAEKFETDFETEFKRVLIHGVLHLCGYKDKSKQDKLLMRNKENFYLEQYSPVKK
ncbi:MAG: rRNA maturation RNase YbeY [Bacteroidetes bacterium]|nr:rRNA maturation RNase YbeY [Bacteroidota bacterium]HET6245318.1 rRNA maturation RNase YbeY [Bacteroidia bacterium]